MIWASFWSLKRNIKVLLNEKSSGFQLIKTWHLWLCFKANLYVPHFNTWMHTLHSWGLSPQTKPTHTFFLKTLSLSCFPQTYYLLGGWALRLGLILSCRFEPAPPGQLSANIQQPLATYFSHSYTFCYTTPIYATTQQTANISAWQALPNTDSNCKESVLLKIYISQTLYKDRSTRHNLG